MRKAAEMLMLSAIRPMSNVPTAPPMGVIIRKEEAIFTFPFTPEMVMANMVGNIIASKA